MTRRFRDVAIGFTVGLLCVAVHELARRIPDVRPVVRAPRRPRLTVVPPPETIEERNARNLAAWHRKAASYRLHAERARVAS